jgi:epoxyqueuosine reductase QueG
MQSTPYTDQWKAAITGWGADLVGVADVAALEGVEVSPAGLLGRFTRAVSIAVRLPQAVCDQIVDRPTPAYAAAYTAANNLLDEIARRTAEALQHEGRRALAIPASQVLDRETWTAAISHKAVARMAGLGWQGKSLLLVTPQFGPRVRLATTLTDAPLVADGPVKNRCGSCMLCRDACPAGAIKGVRTTDRYRTREEAIDLARCAELLTDRFAKLPGIGSSICGVCVKVCPFGT